MSAQILKVIPLSFIVCRFVHQKLRLVPGIPRENNLHRAHDELICHLSQHFLRFSVRHLFSVLTTCRDLTSEDRPRSKPCSRSSNSTARTMMARIGVMRALNRGYVWEFDSSRKDHHWGKRKLKRDL